MFTSKMLSISAWEQRIRRALNKYGLKLHKSRKYQGEYLVYSEDGDEVRSFSSIDKLQNFVEYLKERYAE